MARKLLEHVVEEADPGRDVEAAGAIDIDGRIAVSLVSRLTSALRATLPVAMYHPLGPEQASP